MHICVTQPKWVNHDNVITWECFPYYWHYLRVTYWWTVDSLQKGPMMQISVDCFAVSLDKLLNKKLICQPFEMPWWSRDSMLTEGVQTLRLFHTPQNHTWSLIATIHFSRKINGCFLDINIVILTHYKICWNETINSLQLHVTSLIKTWWHK